MDELPLTIFDLGVLAVVILSALLSLARGATREALTIAGWLGAFVVAYYGFGPVQEVAQRTIDRDWLADAAALVVVFVVPLIVFKAVGAIIAEHVQGGWPGRLDRWAGVIFGALRGIVIVCIAYLGLGIVIEPEQQPAWIRDAVFLPYVQDGALLLRDILPDSADDEGALRAAGAGDHWAGATGVAIGATTA